MTIQKDSRTTSEMLTDGSNKSFPYAFPSFNGDNGEKGLEVRFVTNTGYDVVDPTTYLVLENAEDGGFVQFYNAPPSGKRLVIVGSTPVDQQMDITNHSRFYGKSIERNFDKLVAILQEVYSHLSEEVRQRIANDNKLRSDLYLDFNNFVSQVNSSLDAETQERIAQYAEFANEVSTTLQNEITKLENQYTSFSNGVNTALQNETTERISQYSALVSEIDSRFNQQEGTFQQLNNYYNYLMGRIAAIAVDKGWDASFVVDASGKSQQQVNNGLESIAEMLLIVSPPNGVRVFVKSYYAGLNIGGGNFIYDSTKSAVNDGVMNFNGWVRTNYDCITTSMCGTKGDNIQDDAPFINNGLSIVGTIFADKPKVSYRLKSAITIGQDKVFIGLGKIPLSIDHAGVALYLTGQGAKCKNFRTTSYDTSELGRYKYTGLKIGNGVTQALNCVVDNVVVIYPKIAYHLQWAYWNSLKNIDCYKFSDYGILLSDKSNNNIIEFKQVASNATILPSGNYDFNAVTWEQAAIKISGNQNTITGGEPAPAKYGTIITDNSTGNTINGCYNEHQLVVLKTGVNSQTFFNSSAPLSAAEIHDDSIVYGANGKRFGINMNLPTRPFAAKNGLSAMWFFNEGSGTKIVDHSGNGKHLSVTTPQWVNTGRWGTTVASDAARASKYNDMPTNTFDLTQPFHIVACVKFDTTVENQTLLKFNGTSSSYLSIALRRTYITITDYDGATVVNKSCAIALPANNDGHQWVSLYFDPINKKVHSIDPVIGMFVDESPILDARFSPWLSTGVSSINVFQRFNVGTIGNIAFMAIWQRKLSISDVTTLINTENPIVYSNSSIDSITDSVATDVATLKNDYNGLLAKLRKAGIMT